MTNKGKISRQIVVASAAFFLAVLTALAPTLSHAVADGTIAGTGKGNLAVGTSSKVGNANDAVYATAVGFEAQATENYSTALGVLAQAHSLLTDLLQRMAALERKQKLGPLIREDAKLKPSTSLSPAPTQSR